MPDVRTVLKPAATRDPLRNVRALRNALLQWFDRRATDYPWRRTTDPYAILVSEIMLQQTTVEAVIQNRRFERFLETFPDLEALANAPEDKLLRAWEGLGYYNRARNIQKAARAVLSEHGGEFPTDPGALEALPGVGRYTAGAVASFAFAHPAPIVEANITRVLSRLFDYHEPVNQSSAQSQLWAWSEALLSSRSPRAFNSALMELGQSHCSVRLPACLQCPINDFCHTRDPASLPRKSPRRKTVAVQEHVLFVRRRSGAVLLSREEGARRTGLWRLPERPQDELADFPVLATHRYGITHHRVTLHIHHCSPSQLPAAPAGTTEQFHAASALPGLPMPSPFRRALNNLL